MPVALSDQIVPLRRRCKLQTMAHWTDRPHIATDRIARSNFRALVVVIILLCGVGYAAYRNAPTEPVERFWPRHWRAPPAALVGKAWVIDGDTISLSGTRIRLEGSMHRRSSR